MDNNTRSFYKFKPTDIYFTVVGSINKNIVDKFYLWMNDFGKDNKIIYVPSMSKYDLNLVYLTHGFFLYPTRGEGSSRAIIESMLEGCIPVTSLSSGVEVEHKKNSILIDSWLETDFFSEIFSFDEDSLRDISQCAREIKEIYNEEVYAHQLKKIVESFKFL